MMFFSCSGVIFFLMQGLQISGISLACNFLARAKHLFAFLQAKRDVPVQQRIMKSTTTEIILNQLIIIISFFMTIRLLFISSKLGAQKNISVLFKHHQSEYLRESVQFYIFAIFLPPMANRSEVFQKIENIINQHPIASISIATVSLILLLIRKFHGKFVVYPDVGGRHNSSNTHGYRHPKQRRLEAEDIQIQSDKQITLRGWYVKHPNPERLIVYFHQNAGNIGGRLFYIHSILNKSNANVLLIAYRGFSESDGDSKPYEKQIMKDACAIFRKAMQLAQRDHLPLFVFGRSLGGAAAIHVLSRPQFKYSANGLVLQNTFTSICDVVYNFLPNYLYPLRIIIWLVTSGSYKSISKIKDIHIPILFVKGRRDKLVPAKLMDRLQSEFDKKKGENFNLQVERGTHNDTWYVAGEDYFATINEFMIYCSKI